MKKIIIYHGWKTKLKEIDEIIENLATFTYVMDLSEEEWTKLGDELLDIDQKIYLGKDLEDVFANVNLPFKKQLKALYRKHKDKVDWRFLSYKGE